MQIDLSALYYAEIIIFQTWLLKML
jgi:hypothetical protein